MKPKGRIANFLPSQNGPSHAILHALLTFCCPTRRLEGLEAADLGHILLNPKMITLDVLLEILGNIMYGVRMQVPTINLRFDCRRKSIGAIRPDLCR
ncbi:MAG: hypothetical protein RLZZ444_3910 [Pseudomonadota bacterium]